MVFSSAAKNISITKLVFCYQEFFDSYLNRLLTWPNEQNEGSSKTTGFDCEMLCIHTARPHNGIDNYRTQKGDKTRHW
jgi:hypothetical protein